LLNKETLMMQSFRFASLCLR